MGLHHHACQQALPGLHFIPVKLSGHWRGMNEEEETGNLGSVQINASKVSFSVSYFMCSGVLSVCISVHHTCAMPKETIRGGQIP